MVVYARFFAEIENLKRGRFLSPQPIFLLESQEIVDSYFLCLISYIKNNGHVMGTDICKKVFSKP